jgi:hypothetical protein
LFVLVFIYAIFIVGSGYDSVIPDAPNVRSHQRTIMLAENVSKLVEQYIDAMEKVRCPDPSLLNLGVFYSIQIFCLKFC